MTANKLPLNDFRVIDLTAHRAGPTAARQLADWGAQVIKVEPPGEQVDATGSRRDGFDFQNLHRNKRSMTLNLKSKEGLEVFFKLAERAVSHPKLGPQHVVGQPIHLSAYPQPDELRPTPDQGEHTDEVLHELGYDAAAIAGLRRRGAV